MQADKEAVELLIRGNASPFQKNNEGATPFSLATEAGRPVVANMLAESRVIHAIAMENIDLAIDAIRDGAYVNLRNGAGWTALMLATAQNNVDAVKTILQMGADCNRSENDGWTALHFAASTNAEEIASLLLRYNANPHLRNNAGKTAREIALENDFQDVADVIPEEPKEL